MKIEPKANILLIKKYAKTALRSDIILDESDEEDKNLIAGEVISKGDEEYPEGTTLIFGKYALYLLVLKGESYYFLDKQDVIAICDYKENIKK